MRKQRNQRSIEQTTEHTKVSRYSLFSNLKQLVSPLAVASVGLAVTAAILYYR